MSLSTRGDRRSLRAAVLLAVVALVAGVGTPAAAAPVQLPIVAVIPGADQTTLVVDLSDVSFIDSSGLGAVIETGDRLRRDRRRLAVVAPPGTAAAVALGLTGLRNRLPVFETRDAALDP